MLSTALICLTTAIYFEARSEPIRGQYAVAEVILNRVDDPRFPDTVCEVVAEDRGPKEHDCQFSFMCDGKPERMKNQKARRQARAIATAMLDDQTYFTRGALFYHSLDVNPHWSQEMETVGVFGGHIFFKDS